MRPETIWLLGYPVELGLSVAEHVEDWMREFALMRLSKEAGTATHDVPMRLQQMVRHLSRHYATELSEPDRLRAAAAARGDAVVDLPYPVRPEAEETIIGWQRMLAAVDEYCQNEDLLTLQRSPGQVAVNDWIFEEFLGQLRGEAPRPFRAWSGAASAGQHGLSGQDETARPIS